MTSNANFPRLRLPAISLLLYWTAGFVVAKIDKPYFIGFFYALAAAATITLLLLGWWWFNRQLSWREKTLGFAFLLGEGFIVGKCSHSSVNFFTLWTFGLPLVATVAVAGFWFMKLRKTPLSWLSLALAVTLTWSYFLLIRLDGADSRLTVKTHWRRTLTPEEQFLAESKLAPAHPAMAMMQSAITSAPSRDDWTSFRGPERDGVIRGTSIATNWSSAPVPVWKHAVGPAWSSLLVVGNRLYTQEQRADKETPASMKRSQAPARAPRPPSPMVAFTPWVAPAC
jgi:hypothetical protein